MIMGFLFWLLGAVISPFFAVPSSAGSCAHLVAYGNPEYPPYLWRSTKNPNSLIGANAAYLDQVDDDVKLPIQVQYGGTWARVQEEARYGRVDLIAGAFMTEERKKYLHYFEPAITTTRTVIWVNEKENFNYTKWSDLVGMNGITVINNSFGQKFDDYAKDHLKIGTVASLRQAFEMLRNHRVKYLIYEEWPAKAYVYRYKIKGVKALEPAIADEPLYLVMAKKSPCATTHLRQRIADAHQKVMKKNLMPAFLKEHSLLWDENKN